MFNSPEPDLTRNTEKKWVSKKHMQLNHCLDLDRAPTTKAVGSKYVT